MVYFFRQKTLIFWNKPFSKPDYESLYSWMGFIKLFLIMWVSTTLYKGVWPNLTFTEEVLRQKYLLKGKQFQVQELSVWKRRHIPPLITVPKAGKNTVLQVKFLLVNTKYINFSFCFLVTGYIPQYFKCLCTRLFDQVKCQ